jgi:Ca2+-binding RTX toxin-like protein
VKVDLIVAANNTSDAAGDTLKLVENIIGSGHSDMFAGDNEANVIYGMNGNDALRGQGGAVVLVGGAGVDTFLIQSGTGSDTVKDLVFGVDKVRLLSFVGIGNINDVKALGTDAGANSSCDLGGSEVMIIVGHNIGDLQSVDFLFA